MALRPWFNVIVIEDFYQVRRSKANDGGHEICFWGRSYEHHKLYIGRVIVVWVHQAEAASILLFHIEVLEWLPTPCYHSKEYVAYRVTIGDIPQCTCMDFTNTKWITTRINLCTLQHIPTTRSCIFLSWSASLSTSSVANVIFTISFWNVNTRHHMYTNLFDCTNNLW